MTRAEIGQDGAMPSHLALLRGINVGGRNRVAMDDLRAVVAALGHTEVSTYIQSGNVIFTAAGGGEEELAGELEGALFERLGVSVPVIALARDELARAIAENPFAAEPDLKAVHAIFHQRALGPDHVDRIAVAEGRAAEKGGRDRAVARGRTLYLHTPDGFGRSDLAARLMRLSAGAQAGTARNWATVTTLMGLLEA